jgi:hypothetical protein
MAGVSPTTWQSLETHHQPVADITAAAMARALGWKSDAFERIHRGEEPVEDDDAESAVTVAIQRDPELSSAGRRALLAAYQAIRAQR